MIRFQCPTCKKRLKCPDEGAGRKIECPRCGQRLLIPNPVKPAGRNKTVLGKLTPSIPDWLADVEAGQLPASPSSPAAAPLDRLEEVPDAPKLNRPLSGSANVIRKRKEDGSILLGVLLTIGGLLFSILGFLTLGYWLDYDTSVSTHFGGRVHNVGLMQNRLIGVIVGGGILVVGLALYIVGLFAAPSRTRKWLFLGTALPPFLLFLLMLLLFFLGFLATLSLIR